MNAYCYFDMISNHKQPHILRQEMVSFALEHGVKQAAIAFNTSTKTVYKWLNRFKKYGLKGLFSLSKKPKHSPNAISESMRQYIISLKKKYPRISAETIKDLENVPVSTRTMRKIWKEAGLSSRRRKKHTTKNNLREKKKKLHLFELCMEDTKDLSDIPEYYSFMQSFKLPRHIFSFREVYSGLIILGASSDKSLLKGFLSANYINFCLSKSNLFFDKAKQYFRQTDNGSEFIGSIHAKKPSAYSLAVSSAGFSHVRIFPGAHRMQADVESFHDIIEREFFEIESFSSRNDFMEKLYSYQLFFNLKRKNSYKEHKTPYQLAKIKEPSISDDFFRLPPIDLDAAADLLHNFHVSFGNDVHATP